MRRRWPHLAKERIDAIEPTIPFGKRFWPLADEEKRALDGVVARRCSGPRWRCSRAEGASVQFIL